MGLATWIVIGVVVAFRLPAASVARSASECWPLAIVVVLTSSASAWLGSQACQVSKAQLAVVV